MGSGYRWHRLWLQCGIGLCLLFALASAAAQPAPADGSAAAEGRTVLVMGDSLSAAYGLRADQGWVALAAERIARESAENFGGSDRVGGVRDGQHLVQHLGHFGRDLLAAQGGDVAMVDDPSKLPQASIVETLQSDAGGHVARVTANHVARAAFVLGAGREKKTDAIDLAVGVKVHVKVGDTIEPGAPFATVYANDADRVLEASALLRNALTLSDEPVEPLPLFYQVVYSD